MGNGVDDLDVTLEGDDCESSSLVGYFTNTQCYTFLGENPRPVHENP